MEIANFKGKIHRNEPMSKHTSFAIGGPTDILAYPEDRDDLRRVLSWTREQGLNYFILGGGTNLLVRDKGFRGVMISLQRMNEIRIERENRAVGGTYAVVYAEAGALLAKLLTFAVENGLTGLEFAAGIPGTIGGAVCMNAGTADGEIGDVINSATLLSPEGGDVVKSKDEMKFSYRTSNIPTGHMVLDVAFALRREAKDRIKGRVKDLMDMRKERQPLGMPSAGSVFKNPQEESAGKLIESAGLKGRQVGGAEVSNKHANFIVNRGKATASDVIKLMDFVKQTVLEVHGVRLEPEIKIIGEE